MNTIINEIKSWVANRDKEDELQLGVMSYRVMTMVAYLGNTDEGDIVHRENDLGTAYAIGYTLGHLNLKSTDGAVSYIIGAYNALLDHFTNREINPLQTAEEDNGSSY